MGGNAVISIDHLSCTYSGGVKALRDISLRFDRGRFTGIIGQNGAGKSTLLQHMIGLLKPGTGSVKVLGTDTRDITVSGLAARVGFVLQNPDLQLFASSVKEEVGFGPKNLGMDREERDERIHRALKKVGLEQHLETFPLTLSKGDRAKVVIASVLAMDPEIIILDEPTSGQDHKGNIQIMNIARNLQEEGKTIIVVTHNMGLIARYAERIIVMSHGSVHMDGPVRDVFSRPKELLEAHMKPPHITRLGYGLRDCLGADFTCLKVEELGNAIILKASG
jgi:energy-coupling factor transport system ATP-binding protein